MNQQVTRPELIQCKKSCSACCHTEVAVTDDEAALLADLAQKNPGLISEERLSRQLKAGPWYAKAYGDRACIFLGENQECRVYEHRPSVCRVNFVISHPSTCDTRNGTVRPQRLLMIEEAHLIMAAAFLGSQKTGILPQLVDEKRRERSNAATVLDRRPSC